MGYNITWESKLQTATRLQTIVPNKGNAYDYNHKITNAFVEVKLLIWPVFINVMQLGSWTYSIPSTIRNLL